MARIVVLGVKVLFTRGGQEALVGSLIRELKSRGHEVDLVEVPFAGLPKENLLNQAALWRTLDFNNLSGQKVDLVIATKFPSYYGKFPKKSIWLVHQHRPIYELYGGPFSDASDDPRDEQIRRMLVEGDKQTIAEAQYVSGISRNVIDRLQKYNGIKGEVLYPPLPLGNKYRNAAAEPYILSVGRLCVIKRVDYMIKAMPHVLPPLKLKIVGVPDEPQILDYYKNEIAKHNIQSRVEFLGRVDDETLIDLYSKALAVYYAPFDEDYGYVTLEAMASGRPVIAAKDSGGVLEFVKHEETGLVVDPTTDSFANAANILWTQRERAAAMGETGLQFMRASGLLEQGWERVIDGLLSPLKK